MIGSNPFDFDTDGDGLFDGLERRLGTALDDADTDHDGLLDFVEFSYGFDPPKKDVDLLWKYILGLIKPKPPKNTIIFL